MALIIEKFEKTNYYKANGGENRILVLCGGEIFPYEVKGGVEYLAFIGDDQYNSSFAGDIFFNSNGDIWLIK